MKRYRVTVDGQTYEVEIDDPRARPVPRDCSARRFWLTSNPAMCATDAAAGAPPQCAGASLAGPSLTGTAPRTSTSSRRRSRGPSQSLSVIVGQTVQRGDALLTIEAMKMFNLIRSPRAGTIAAVHVTERRRSRRATC